MLVAGSAALLELLELAGRIKRWGKDLGFQQVGICDTNLQAHEERLLDWLDRANRWLYAPRSPLNWLTRRRHMRVIPRKPEGTSSGRRLLSGSGIGLVELDAQGVPWRIRELMADGRAVLFSRGEAESRWD